MGIGRDGDNVELTYRLDVADGLANLASRRFVLAHEDYVNAMKHDPMYADPFDRMPGFEGARGFEHGFPVNSSTVMMRGAATLRWTEEFEQARGMWRLGHGD